MYHLLMSYLEGLSGAGCEEHLLDGALQKFCLSHSSALITPISYQVFTDDVLTHNSSLTLPESLPPGPVAPVFQVMALISAI